MMSSRAFSLWENLAGEVNAQVVYTAAMIVVLQGDPGELPVMEAPTGFVLLASRSWRASGEGGACWRRRGRELRNRGRDINGTSRFFLLGRIAHRGLGLQDVDAGDPVPPAGDLKKLPQFHSQKYYRNHPITKLPQSLVPCLINTPLSSLQLTTTPSTYFPSAPSLSQISLSSPSAPRPAPFLDATMDSGSGKNPDDTESVDSLRQRESSSSDATAADDADSPPPSLPPPSKITEVEGNGPPEAGGRKTAEQKGKAAQKAEDEEASLFWSAWGSAGDKPAALPPRAPTGGEPPLPPLPPEGQSSADIDLKGVFDELMLESQAEKRTGEPDQKDEAQGMPPKQLLISEQAKSLALLPKKGKKPLLRKVLDKIGVSNRKYTLATSANVNYQKVHITELIRHYNLLEMVAGRGVEFHTNALNLRNAYFAFRPVLGDGECFYRSFIFSYLEQVLDRQDTHEEHRVLAAVKGVASQHAGLGWTSEFPRSHKAFKKLIKKVKRWKKQGRWNKSYRLEKLLKFFNDHKRANDIFTFLRLVAAIWMCSHSEEFVPLIPELNEDRTLTEWCFQEVIQRRVFTDHIQITALTRALRVPLRVEYLFQAAGQDLYIGQDPQDDMPRSTRWPRRHHQVPPDHEVPHVTVLYTQEHYDIMYPYHPDDPVTSGESSDQRSDKTESQAAKSKIGSSSGEKSNQQIDRVEGSTSTGEKSDEHPAERES